MAIAGYVRIHGELTVLCLISASLTFNLQIGYQKSNGQSMVFGEAELVVEIEVLFLSFDVKVRCRREFAGGQGDPKFIDLIPGASVWAESTRLRAAGFLLSTVPQLLLALSDCRRDDLLARIQGHVV